MWLKKRVWWFGICYMEAAMSAVRTYVENSLPLVKVNRGCWVLFCVIWDLLVLSVVLGLSVKYAHTSVV